MQIRVRTQPDGRVSVYFNGVWQETTPEWVAARRADSHTIIEEGQPSPAPAVSGFQASGIATPSQQPAGAGLTAPGGSAYTPQQLERLYNLTPGAVTAPSASLIAPDGQAYTPAQLQTLYGSPTATGTIQPPAVAPATSAAGSVDPANPGLVWDPALQAYRDTRDPYARPASASAGPGAAQSIAPPSVIADADLLRTAAPSPAAGWQGEGGSDPAAARTAAERWYAALGGTPETRRYAGGGAVPAGQAGTTPNAIVGEGLESETRRFDQDKPQRLEEVAIPTGKPSNYDLYWVEGPIAVELPPDTLIHPIAAEHEQTWRDRLLPLSGVQLKKRGTGFVPKEGGDTVIAPPMAGGGRIGWPSGWPSGLGALLPASSGENPSPTPAPAPTLITPPLIADPWAGITRNGWGNLSQYLAASEMARTRRDQELRAGGNLEGAQGEMSYFQRMAPGRIAAPSWR